MSAPAEPSPLDRVLESHGAARPLLAAIRAQPGIAQSDLVTTCRVAPSSVSAALAALETVGAIDRRRVEGSRPLLCYPATPRPRRDMTPDEPPPLRQIQAQAPPDEAAVLRARVADLERSIEGSTKATKDLVDDLADAAERAEDLEEQIQKLTKERDAADAAMLEIQEANSRWLAEVDAALDLAEVPRALEGWKLTTPERARLLVWASSATRDEWHRYSLGLEQGVRDLKAQIIAKMFVG